ncbi:MAG: hypothetical protein ABIP88_09600, partial [Candidatus Binatia bacterium]
MARATDDSPLVHELAALSGVRIKFDEPLARYTSMKIGGPADYFIEADNGAALAAVLIALRRHQVPLCLLGNGSNV